MPDHDRLSPVTRRLIEVLRTVPLRATVSYAELAARAGADVTAAHSGHLASALRILERDEGCVFLTQRGTGLRRLAPAEAPDVGRRARTRIRRAADAGAARIRALVATANGLPADAAAAVTREIATLGLLAEAARDREPEAPEAAAPPDVADLARRLAARLTKGK